MAFRHRACGIGDNENDATPLADLDSGAAQAEGIARKIVGDNSPTRPPAGIGIWLARVPEDGLPLFE